MTPTQTPAQPRVLSVGPDEPAFPAWYDVVEQARRAQWPDEPSWQLEELRALARAGQRPGAAERVETLVAVEDGEVVGAARLDLPTRDNTHLVCLEHLAVRPGRRRRGVGSALLAAVDARAAELGRRELLVEVEQPAGVQRTPGRAFVEAAGFRCALVEVRRDLDVPVPQERLDALEADCLPHAQAYDLRLWEDRCPDDLVEDRALLARRMSTDAPLRDVPWEEEDWDVDRVRTAEQLLRDQGRARLAAGAVHRPSGRLVAFTEMAVPAATPERGYQWDTLVLREHRGHRLGTLVKLANLRRVPHRWPGTRVVSTWNAEENAPMIAVNEALGCRVAGSMGEWLRPVAGARG